MRKFWSVARAVVAALRPVPQQWAVVEEMPSGWLEIRSVSGSFDHARIIYSGLLDSGTPVSMMRPADVDRHNLRLTMDKRSDDEPTG